MEMFHEFFTANNLHKKVQQIIKPCNTCKQYKDNNKKSVGETHPVVPKSKEDIVSVEYYRLLLTSTGEVKHILVMVDTLTKYMRNYILLEGPPPLSQSINSKNTSRCLENQWPCSQLMELLTVLTVTQFTSQN